MIELNGLSATPAEYTEAETSKQPGLSASARSQGMRGLFKSISYLLS